jgi:hypothetical protein
LIEYNDGTRTRTATSAELSLSNVWGRNRSREVADAINERRAALSASTSSSATEPRKPAASEAQGNADR